MTAMFRKALALAALAFLAACGGGGSSTTSSSSNSTTTAAAAPPTPALTNLVSVVVDQGPASLNTGPNAYTSANVAFVSVTLCAPGGNTNCQTIDHVQVDTGSVGLRIFASVLNPSLLSALPAETDPSANPVGECYQYVDGYVFGSVRQANMTVGGESVANMPFHVLSDTGVFSSVPSSCSSSGGSNLGTVADFGANGIIGIGVTQTDCGSACTVSGGQSAAIYYDCPSTGCAMIIARAAASSAPFQQVPNPVAAFAVDNNGTILVLPAAPAAGAPTANGTLYFGIGTQSNNGLGSAQILTATGSSSPYGAGLVNVTYKGTTLPASFLDSGSSLYFFVDSAVTPCPTSGAFKGYYCPSPPLNLSPTIQGQNGLSVSGDFTLYDAQTQFSSTNAVVPGVGGNPNIFFPKVNFSNSFDYGLPFFYGRSVYTAIEGRTAAGTPGPYFAF
jgi:hypothetical protein